MVASDGEQRRPAAPEPAGSDAEPEAGAQARSRAEARFDHDPVMVDEVVELATDLPGGPFLDATLGGAGHAQAVLAANANLRLVGIDRDPTALAAATQRLARYRDRVELHRLRFDQALDVVSDPLSGFLFDLGVSSPQLDRGERGFSFRNDGPLDMRMDPDSPLRAADVVNFYQQRELAELLRRNADERHAPRIAAAIVAARPIESTSRLADVVAEAIPAPARRTSTGHPARRTFQAIRIEVNDELRILAPALDRALDALAPGGRGIVITYHSGEDRIAKEAFRRRTTSTVPAGLPVQTDDLDFTIVRPAARKASDEEQARNPRATSARLRAIERLVS
jgi:16S rRNA (cytosine1402-N4)-methyltransferase